MKIRPCLESDLSQVAAIHKAQFKGFFLGHYSEGLLAEYYRMFLHSFIFLVYESDQCLGGFVLGGRVKDVQAARSRFLRQHVLRLAAETLIRPRVYLMVLNRILGVFRRSEDHMELPDYTVLAIAVAPDLMGSTTAKDLIEAFESRIAPAAEYRLTVNRNNARAKTFYLKNGFQVNAEDGDKIFLFKRLPQTSSESPGNSEQHTS